MLWKLSDAQANNIIHSPYLKKINHISESRRAGESFCTFRTGGSLSLPVIFLHHLNRSITCPCVTVAFTVSDTENKGEICHQPSSSPAPLGQDLQWAPALPCCSVASLNLLCLRQWVQFVPHTHISFFYSLSLTAGSLATLPMGLNGFKHF